MKNSETITIVSERYFEVNHLNFQKSIEFIKSEKKLVIK